MLESYKTVLNKSEAEIIEKKSRFIATVSPVATSLEAQLFIDTLRKKYWDATHNVFAYRIDLRSQKYSDDGEPSGTAGLPVLEVIRGFELINTVVVVTRYFGGTLLGTGGLVRAYSKAAKEGINCSLVVEKMLYQQFKLITDYSSSGKISYEILQNGYIIDDTFYTDKVLYIVLVKYNQKDKFVKEMVELTNGQCEITVGELVYQTVAK